MTTYLVERLRDYAHNRSSNPEDHITWHAANEIEMLMDRIEENTVLMISARVRIEELEEALQKALEAAPEVPK